MLLRWVFATFGPSALAARLVAAGFGLVLFGAFYQLVRRRLDTCSALLAAFFLAASPEVLKYSVAAMLEVPAIGTALLSAWLLFQWGKRPHWGWLCASGLVMGLALGIKLTAVMVAPAIVVEIALLRAADRSPAWRRQAFRTALQWAVVVGITFIVIGLAWGRGSLATSWKSHAMEHAVPGMAGPNDYPFQPIVFLDQLECVVGAAVALLFVVRQRRWRDVAFPLVLLLTALIVHAIHRPWWSYYYLHLAVPLAWLTGFATGEVIRVVGQLWTAGPLRLGSKASWQWVGLALLTALGLAMSEARLEKSIKDLRQSPRTDSSALLAEIRQYAPRTHWCYARSMIYPFQAGLSVPPELTVVVLKRFWSDQITRKEIVDICHRYQPEQLLLHGKQTGGEWKSLVDAEYALEYQDKEYTLYVAKRIEEKKRPVW
jgi:4-amino-4-deoxy-L-arabinose transferase-like glycosyltransferase